MAFWGNQFWSADYWSADYWAETAAAAPSYVQYPDVELTIGPSSVQTLSVDYSHVGTPALSFNFAAPQTYIGGDFEQTVNVQITFTPSSTQTVTTLEYDQTGDVGVVFQFTAPQYLGLVQVANPQITFGFSAGQTVGSSILEHDQVGDLVVNLRPYTMQVLLERFFGLEAQFTTADVEGFPSVESTGILAPAQDVVGEEYFEFLVYSSDIKWLGNAGSLGQPVYIEVAFQGVGRVSVNLYNSRFVVGPTMGEVYTQVRDGLANRNLSVTLRAYELFSGYVLSEALSEGATIIVRGYEERRVV